MQKTHVEMLQKEIGCLIFTNTVLLSRSGHTDDMLISVVVSVVAFVLWSVMMSARYVFLLRGKVKKLETQNTARKRQIVTFLTARLKNTFI